LPQPVPGIAEPLNLPLEPDMSDDESAYKPIAYTPSAVAGPEQLSSVRMGDSIVRHTGKVKLSQDENGVITVRGGEALVCAQDTTVLKAGSFKVCVDKGAVALITREHGVLKVRTLHEESSRSVRIYHGTEFLAVRPGQEAMLAYDGDTVARAMKLDPVGRRMVRDVCFGSGACVSRADVSLVSLASLSPTVGGLMKSAGPEHRAVAARLMKTAASLMMVTAQRGPYKSNTQ